MARNFSFDKLLLNNKKLDKNSKEFEINFVALTNANFQNFG